MAQIGGQFIRLSGWHSRKINPRRGRSIVAGDVQARNEGKVALYHIMEQLHEQLLIGTALWAVGTATEMKEIIVKTESPVVECLRESANCRLGSTSMPSPRGVQERIMVRCRLL